MRNVILMGLFGLGLVSFSVMGGCGGDTDTNSFPTGGPGTTAGGTAGAGGLFNTTGNGPTSTSGTGGQGGSMPTCDPNPTEGLHAFSQRYGDGSAQSATSVAADGAGNMIVAGVFAGTLTFGALPGLTSVGSNDTFVAKLNAVGTPAWAKRFGDAANQSLTGVATDAQGNVVITGHFLGSINFGGANFTVSNSGFSNAFLAKFDPQGGHLWSKNLGGLNNDDALGVAIDATGNIAIVGEYETTIDFGNGVVINSAQGGTNDAFVAVFDAQGTIKWARTFGNGPNAQSGHAVAFDEMGNVLVTGDAQGSIDFGQGPQMVLGSTNTFVMKINAAGTPLWGKLFGSDDSQGDGIATDGQGNIFVVGSHRGDIDFGGLTLTTQIMDYNAFVAKLDPNGNHLWSKTLGDNLAQHALGVIVDGAGKAIITGDFGGSLDFGGATVTSAGATDVFVAKLDTVGCPVWVKAFGDTLPQYGTAVALGPNGNSVVAGRMQGGANFGGQNLTSGGVDDVFVAAFGP